ncbi:MAG: hypothetical protein LAN18_01100 [Acidobacteriia bacterium]|nr:hypothetical protein [Terriglobia bacterium]
MTTNGIFPVDEATPTVAPDSPDYAPADGKVAPRDGNSPQPPANLKEALRQLGLGPNNELLEDQRPDLVNALRELEVQYRQEGIVARRHEIRRIRQARLFWQGLQYAWWNPQDMTWHLPYESKIYDDAAMAEMPRYQFVTNLYQAFGLSFISVLSQDVPATRFYPQSAQSIADISTAKAASQVSELVEQNNRVQHLLTGVAFYLWTDGKIGGYVRYIADAQRFGSHDEPVIEEHYVPLGEDTYACPGCGEEQAVGASQDESVIPSARTEAPRRGEARNLSASIGDPGDQSKRDSSARSVPRNENGRNISDPPEDDNGGNTGDPSGDDRGSIGAPSLLPPVVCRNCGASLGPEHFKPAQRVAIPVVTGVRRVANGQEVISVVGGLELNTPVWANEMHEFPYLQWSMEVHRAKLKASYPHAADKIQMGGPQSADEVYARASRVAIAQGLPTTHPGDALFNLVTFSRTWIRPWAFYAIEDKAVRDALLALFPDGCYVAFAGDTYCESRNETMDDRWRVMHALPGDGQNRPSVGDSLVQIQERYNTLSNIQAETYEYGIPPIYADPQVLDFDALSNQTAEPAAHYPARARPGQPLAAGFFQPAPAQVPPDLVRHQQDLMGPVAQFLTGLFPAVFGGEMDSQKTATGYAMARDQALGRLGLVWRRLKQFYADVMLLSVDCFRKNRPEDAEIPILGPGGEFESRWIRLADLRGNIQAHPESDETFPRLKSQQRAVVQQLMASSDPLIQQALADPANIGFVKSVLGLADLVVPGEDSRNKQLREIEMLLQSAPISANVIPSPGEAGTRNLSGVLSGTGGKQQRDSSGHTAALGMTARLESQPPRNGNDGAAVSPGATLLPTVQVDLLFDNHAVELEECRRWANSDAGQVAHMENPAGFANVRAHAEAHLRAIGLAYAAQSAAPAAQTTKT